jgi:uncharacterized protein YcbX
MPTLERITIFPVKSLDGVEVPEARVLPSGALEHDRRWQIVDMEGRVVNAKRTPLMHAIRAEFDLGEAGAGSVPRLGTNVVSLAVDPAALAAAALPGLDRLAGLEPESFPLLPGPEGPCDWLSEALGEQVLLVERAEGGFPDDRDAPGPTLAATATLLEVARWFGFDLAESRRRFRVNLEIGGCDAFWEDVLASPARPELQPSLTALSADVAADPYADLPPPEPLEFMVGSVRFRATNACRRCAVPGRDSRTGAVTAHFRDAFEARRVRGLRPDVDVSSWSHFYRLAVNTRLAGEAGGRIGFGSTIVVTQSRPSAIGHSSNSNSGNQI